MIVNGLHLPERFVRCVDGRELSRDVGSWELQEADAYGNPFESELGEIYDTHKTISKATSDLSEDFKNDGFYGGESDSDEQPGFISDIVDFTDVICFGVSGDGAPFCFDYRKGIPPSVIWWDDVYWRRVAPEFDSFLQLVIR